MKQNVAVMKSINEKIRENDAINIEREQVKVNFSDIYELIDMNARAIFIMEIYIRALIKYYYDFNHYRQRDVRINGNKSIIECLRYSAEEDWDYVVRYNENRVNKTNFIRDLVIELVKRKPPDIKESEIIEMINDIRKYLI